MSGPGFLVARNQARYQETRAHVGDTLVDGMLSMSVKSQ